MHSTVLDSMMECTSRTGARQLHGKPSKFLQFRNFLVSVFLLGILHECLAGVPSVAEIPTAPVGAPVIAHGPAMGTLLAGSPASLPSAQTFDEFLSPEVQKSAFRIKDMRSPFNASTLFVPDDIELEYVNITQRIAGDATLPISDAFRWALAEVLNDFYEANFNISVSLRSIIPAESVSTKSVGPPCDLNSVVPTLSSFNAVEVQYMLSVDQNSSLPAWGAITMATVEALHSNMARLGFQVRFLAHTWTRLEPPVIPIMANLPPVVTSGFRFQIVMTGKRLYPFTVQKQTLFSEIMFHLVVARTGLYEVTLLAIEETAGTNDQPDNVLVDMCMAQAAGVGQLDRIIQWVFDNADQEAIDGATTLGAAVRNRALLAGSQSAFMEAMADAGLPIDTVKLLQMRPTHNATFSNQLATVLGTNKAGGDSPLPVKAIVLGTISGFVFVCIAVFLAGYFVWRRRRGRSWKADAEAGKKPRRLGGEGRHSNDSAEGEHQYDGYGTPSLASHSQSQELLRNGGATRVASTVLAQHVAAQSGKTADSSDCYRNGDGSPASSMVGIKSPDSDSLMQRKSNEARGWELDPSDITICTLPDGSDWLLGKGGGGAVFRGLRCGVQDIAVKIMYQVSAADIKQFNKEVSILKSLSFDKNVVQFYGACMGGPCPLLVLEYMEGGDLWDALCEHKGELHWYQKGRKIAMDVARGLHFLHHNKVRHGDLKSKNILLTSDFQTAKIGDVGMAKVMHSETTAKADGGTFVYAAPELLFNQRCDEKADIYSFGVVMWELCTLERPVRGEIRPLKVPEEGPEEIASLISACMRTNPESRPTARQAFDIIRAISPGRVSMSGTDSGELADDPCTPSANSSLPPTTPSGSIPNSVLLADLYGSHLCSVKEEADDVAATPLLSNHKPDPPSAAPPNHAGGTVADLPAAAAPPSAFKISVVGSCDTRPEKQEGPPAQAEAGTTTVEPKEGAGSTLQDESGCEADADGLPRAGLRAPLEKLRKAGLGAPLVSAKRVLRTHNSDEGDLELVYTNVDAIQEWLDKRQKTVRRSNPKTLDKWWPTQQA